MHQEDGCQATATPPGLKYEEQGGPALRDLADVIRNFGDPRDVTSLLRRTTFNMAVGNADAHAKNFSLLHEPGVPAVRLAPLYDVLDHRPRTDRQYGTADAGGNASGPARRRAGRHPDGDRGQPDRRSGGVGHPCRGAASAIVTEILDQVLAAIPATPGDARVLAVISKQAERINRG